MYECESGTNILPAPAMSARRLSTEELAALARQACYCREALAAHLGMTERTLRRLFQRQFQCAPKVWLLGRRMEAAAQLLREGLSMKETAATLGFQHASSFTREFKRHFGCVPREYQNQQFSAHHLSPPPALATEMSGLVK